MQGGVLRSRLGEAEAHSSSASPQDGRCAGRAGKNENAAGFENQRDAPLRLAHPSSHFVRIGFTHHPAPTPLRACRLHGSSCIEVRRRMVRLGRVLARWHPWAEGPRRPSARKCRPLAGTTVRRPDEWRREPRTYNFIGLVLESVCGCPLASARRTLVHPRYTARLTATVLHIPPLTLEQGESGESRSPGNSGGRWFLARKR